MSYTAFNQNVFDHKKEPMFFGQPPAVARYDDPKHSFFERQTRRMVGFFWVPEEISLEQDRRDFAKLTESEQHIFLSNLKYQTLLDSIQGRAVSAMLLPVCSSPELETYIETWGFSETVHSRSYTHIIRNVLPDPSEFFDSIPLTPEIMERAEAVSKYYDDFYQKMLEGEVYGWNQTNTYAAKVALFKCMVAVNVLEAIRFYVSFACSFAFAERGLMEGNAKTIKFIARDEATHLGGTQYILKEWLNGTDDPVMNKIANDNIEVIYEIFEEAGKQEKDWAKYLFKDGSMVGLNAEILCQFADFKVNERLQALGLEPLTEQLENPLPWMRQWTTSSETNVAPQETEISSYLVGAIDTKIDVDALETI